MHVETEENLETRLLSVTIAEPDPAAQGPEGKASKYGEQQVSILELTTDKTLEVYRPIQ